MAKFSGKANFKDLQALQERFERITNNQLDEINEELVKYKAQVFLNKAVLLTTVGEYEDGRVGGVLRRGWTVKSHREAELSTAFGGSDGVKKYAESLTVTKSGKDYTIEIINPVSYASYVNYGHRTRGGGFTEGQFFMEKALAQTKISSKAGLKRKTDTLLRRAINGD